MARYVAQICLCLVGTAAARSCLNQTIDLQVTSRNGVFDNLITPTTDQEAVNFVLATSKQGSNGTAQALTGYNTTTGTYHLSTQYCKPSAESNSGNSTEAPPADNTLSIYWDLAYNAYNYSYVSFALDHGYHTLSYDRLGIGASSHGDPKSEIQTQFEVAALAQLTQLVRNGSFPGMPMAPRQIVHVGHSFGSVQTFELTALYPDLSDAIVLTGFSTNLSFFDHFLAGGNWHKASLEPRFYPDLLAYVETVKQPVSVSELLTIGTTLPPTNPFPGPALVISGSNDVPFCG
ncbi:hypothetical protein BJX64DRAFT_294999 [Aspergillus heterothallicus]